MNRKKKILLIAILLVIAIISIFIFLKGKGYVKASTSDVPEPFTISITEEKMIKEYNNIYNVDYIQQLIKQDTESVYETTALAQIRGEEVTFTNYYSGSTDYTTKNITTSEGNTCLENNIMAAIITGVGLENIGYKVLTEESYYSSGAQLAIWEFWNTWVENSGAKENGFEKGSGNGTITENGINGEEQRKNAQQCATQKEYYANIYFLKYIVHNNSHEFGVDNQPNLILIEALDEDGELIEPERKVEENSEIYILVANDKDNVIQVGDEITYNINAYNESKEEQQDLVLSNKLPKGVTITKVVEILDGEEVELSESVGYNYNKKTRRVEINIDKIEAATEGTMTLEEEEVKYIQSGSRKYKITVKANELKEGIYSKEIENVAEVQKGNSILARTKTGNIISDIFLELEPEELPETINENEEFSLGLRITNKGLIDADNVDVKIFIPQEILMNKYTIITSSENEEDEFVEGTLYSNFEDNSIQVLSQKSVFIQLTGSINGIEETKQIIIEGTVNGEKITWTTSAQKEGGY